MKGPEAKIIGFMEGADKRSVSARRIMRCCLKIYMRVLHKYAYGIFCKKMPLIFLEICGIILIPKWKER